LVAQFKTHLLRTDPQSGKRSLADATVNRTLGTLKNFYGWMFRSRYVSHDPTTEVDRPKLKEPMAQNLNDNELELIYQAAVDSHLPERNLALIFVLLHGLRASEVNGLNLADYDEQRLLIREAKADKLIGIYLSSALSAQTGIQPINHAVVLQELNIVVR
jgi:integrase/recombinase XerD